MSGLLLSLSLLYAATFLQSSASADDCIDINCTKTVCLKCNTPVIVAAGQTVTLKCSICPTHKDFDGTKYAWSEDADVITCNSGSKYSCQWDNQTYVLLNILNVVEDKKYEIEIMGNRGHATSEIEVQVIKMNETIRPEPTTTPQSATNDKAFLLFIILPLIALGIFCFLFGTDRGRKITEAIRKEKTRGDYSETDTTLGSQDPLTV